MDVKCGVGCVLPELRPKVVQLVFELLALRFIDADGDETAFQEALYRHVKEDGGRGSAGARYIAEAPRDVVVHARLEVVEA